MSWFVILLTILVALVALISVGEKGWNSESYDYNGNCTYTDTATNTEHACRTNFCAGLYNDCYKPCVLDGCLGT
jgi:hypothetical protein